MILDNVCNVVKNNVDSQGVESYYAHLWEAGPIGGYVAKEDKQNEGDDKLFLPYETINSESPKFLNIPIVCKEDYGHPQTAEEVKNCTVGYVTSVFQNTNGYFLESSKKFVKPNGLWTAKLSLNKEQMDKVDFSKIKGISNAYNVIKKTAGGVYNGIEYAYKITEIEPDHIALVANPRYSQCFNLIKNQMNEKNDKSEDFLKMDKKLDSLMNLVESIKNEQEEKKEEKERKENSKDEMENEYDVEGEKVSLKELINTYKRFKKNELEKENSAEKEEKEKKEEEKEEKEKKENSTASDSASTMLPKKPSSKKSVTSIMTLKDITNSLNKKHNN